MNAQITPTPMDTSTTTPASSTLSTATFPFPGQPLQLHMPDEEPTSVCQLLENRMRLTTQLPEAIQLLQLAIAQAKHLESQLGRATEENTDLSVKLRALEHIYAGVRRPAYVVIGGIGMAAANAPAVGSTGSPSGARTPEMLSDAFVSETDDALSLNTPTHMNMNMHADLSLSSSSSGTLDF